MTNAFGKDLLGNEDATRRWIDALSFISFDKRVLVFVVRVLDAEGKLANGVASLRSLEGWREINGIIIITAARTRAPVLAAHDYCFAGGLWTNWGERTSEAAGGWRA